MSPNTISWDNDVLGWNLNSAIPWIEPIRYPRGQDPTGPKMIEDMYRKVGQALSQAIDFKRKQVLCKGGKNLDRTEGVIAAGLAMTWANKFIDTINDVTDRGRNKGEAPIDGQDSNESEKINIKDVKPEVVQAVISFFMLADQTSLDNAVDNSDLADDADGETDQTVQ